MTLHTAEIGGSMLNFLTVYFFAAIILTAFASAYLYARGKRQRVLPVLALSMSICFYVFGYNIELHMHTIQAKLFWNYFQYIGIPFVSTFWLLTALIYTHRLERHKALKLFYVFGIPAVTFMLRFTNHLHHLYFTNYWLVEDNGILFLAKGKGPWFYVQSLHSMSMVLAALVIYVISYVNREKFEGNNVAYMLAASLIACGGLVLNIFGLGLPEIDHMVIFLPLTIPVVLMAIMKENFWEIRTRVRDMVFEDNEDSLILFNKARRVVDFNWEAEKLFSAQGIALKVGETQIYDLQSTLFSPIAESLLGESDVQDVITLQNEGKAAYYEFKLLALSKHHLDTESFLLSLRDVTAREHFQQILQFQASTDSLSELLNRRAFFERVGECTAHAPEDEQEIGRLPDAEEGQCYLLMLDIDHFKKINDTYGHAVGDMVIKEIGAILKRCFNSADVIGRIGGEEFAIFYRDLSHEQLMILIAHFMEALKAIRSEHLPAISASIGIAETDGRIPVEVLMKEADKALYNAKETGRNKAVFYNAL